MPYDQQEILDYLHLFEWERHCPEWEQYKSTEATRLLCERAVSLGGFLSVSHFIISFQQLCESGAIKQLRAPKPAAVEEPELTPESYRKISARETARRYMQEPDFKTQVDSLISRGLIVLFLAVSISGVFA